MSLAGIVAKKGADVVFTTDGTASTDETTETDGAAVETTVSGKAMRIGGDPKRYAALELKESEAPTLLFVPATQGQMPPLEATVTWGGKVHAVRDVDPLDMDGRGGKAARVIVAR